MAEGAGTPVPVVAPAGAAANGPQAPVKPAPQPNGKAPVKGAPVPGQTAETPKPPEWRFKEKLKVYGKDQDVDWGPEEIRRNAQKMLAADRQLAEARKVQDGARRLFELAKNDPEAFMRQLGSDPKDWAAKYLAKQATDLMLTPEERAQQEQLNELESLRKQVADNEKSQANAKLEAETAQLRAENERKFLPALEKVNLPKTHETLYLLGETALMALNDGVEYTPDELAAETERRVNTFTTAMLGNFEGPALLKRLGPELTAKIVEASIAQFDAEQAHEASVGDPERHRAPEKPEPKQEYITEAEARKRLRGRL